ncbi:hypothetical protein LF844_09930 [Metapseudomonas lalkuanensis]|uniref:hypothetical protein n=1 Tax=Metapseudomonas lalkuanensis TaxID=2604832 RepID=UPI001CF262AE|nr:hypothetical protein [Pseudomonas lalkuanensis]UCP00108.1 hypothetical protein LF844_09930 [Pseudomonas lalkuanensis]
MTDTTQTAEAYVLVVEAATDPVLVEGGEDYVITLEQTESVVIGAGEQGPPGPQGIPGPAGGSSLQCLAGEVVSALRVLYELDGEVFALDYRDAAHIDLLLGVSLTAAEAGQLLNVQRTGVIEDGGWSWQPGRIWLGIDGQLTQTSPVDGFDVLLGAAVSATRITLNIQDPIDLE